MTGIIIILAAALASAIFFLGTPKGKGMLGEWRVRAVIGKTKVGVRYVLNDCMFVFDGKSVQIDHIVINKGGVYVIETKNYSGRIYGSDAQKTWVQTLAGGRVKNHFYSPVKQNQAHIYSLGKLLGENVYLCSLVVFVQNNTKYVLSDRVIPISALRSRLALPQKKKPYTEEEMAAIYEAICSQRSTEVSKKEHVSRLKDNLRKINECICPRCGKALVKRSGAYGEFYGCTGYPDCTFTKK